MTPAAECEECGKPLLASTPGSLCLPADGRCADCRWNADVAAHSLADDIQRENERQSLADRLTDEADNRRDDLMERSR